MNIDIRTRNLLILLLCFLISLSTIAFAILPANTPLPSAPDVSEDSTPVTFLYGHHTLSIPRHYLKYNVETEGAPPVFKAIYVKLTHDLPPMPLNDGIPIVVNLTKMRSLGELLRDAKSLLPSPKIIYQRDCFFNCDYIIYNRDGKPSAKITYDDIYIHSLKVEQTLHKLSSEHSGEYDVSNTTHNRHCDALGVKCPPPPPSLLNQDNSIIDAYRNKEDWIIPITDDIFAYRISDSEDIPLSSKKREAIRSLIKSFIIGN